MTETGASCGCGTGDPSQNLTCIDHLPDYLRHIVLPRNAALEEYKRTNNQRKWLTWKILHQAVQLDTHQSKPPGLYDFETDQLVDYVKKVLRRNYKWRLRYRATKRPECMDVVAASSEAAKLLLGSLQKKFRSNLEALEEEELERLTGRFRDIDLWDE